ncbi:MAG: pyridoxal-phosphate dependent enzyme [Alphaproteobacteria bacterium]|nr:pyridoxal-phosphate dependent enzyme [Alphaproteobacteria bacterium]
MPDTATAAPLITLDEIRAVRAAMPAVIRRTPILPLAREPLEIGAERLFLKLETHQVTGAYKPRAAFAVMNALSPAARAKGVVMTSSGNFAQGFALAGRIMKVPVVVVMLDRTSPYKVAATRAHGAEVFFSGTDAAQRQPTVERVARERGMTAIDTWEDRPVALGHAGIGLEIVEDMPDVEQVLVPVSSGGMAAGTATAIKLLRPDIKVIGVQPERANAYWVSRQRGEPTLIDYWDSMADGLSAVRPGEFPFRHLQKYMDDVVLIREQDIADAFRMLLFRGKVLGEPAGVVAAAGFLAGKVDQSKKTLAVVTGGNLTEEMVGKLLAMSKG